MAHVTVIGTGNMGTAIGGLVTRGGNTLETLGSGDATTPVTGDIVVLAVPYTALADIVAARGESLAGKVVVDITNPLDFATFTSPLPEGSSATSELAAALPSSRVVKAFNTTFAATLASGTVGESGPTTVLIAGDDDSAKSAVAALVTDAGLAAIDAGPLARATELEALARLQIGLAVTDKVSWTGGFAVAA